MVGLDRLELSTSPLSGARSSHLSYRPHVRAALTETVNGAKTLLGPQWRRCGFGTGAASIWWSWSGSNRRPPECKSGALPTELQPPKEKFESRPVERDGYQDQLDNHKSSYGTRSEE